MRATNPVCVETVIGAAALRKPLRNPKFLAAVMQAMRTAGETTARDLARELKVSERTVYRAVDTLQTGGAPIVGLAGKGYRWHE